MQIEAKCIASTLRILEINNQPLIFCGGPGPDRVSIICNQLERRDISGVVSFGIAGGLNPNYKTGSVLLPSNVLTSDKGSIPTNDCWRSSIAKNWPSANQQTLQLGVNEPVTDKVDKERLYRTHKAHAVDMESHIIGTYAQKRNIPFLILRSVADTSDTAIPEVALSGLDKNGKATPFKLIKKIFERPGDIKGLVTLAIQTNVALRELKKIPKQAMIALCDISKI